MGDLVRQADELIQKINRLLDRNDKLIADMLEKDEKIRELNQQLKVKSERIRQLEEETVSARVSENIHLPGMDTKEIRKKINDYLRELDRCIAKLSAEG
jgi:DNA anti-recombination protein RmuC